MGHNVDFVQILNLPEKVRCPNCRFLTKSNFDEYDIDCGEPNPKKGEWILDVTCEKCEEQFEYKFVVKVTKDKEDEKVCGECSGELVTKEEKDFGQCDKCCAWKYRDNSK